MPEQVVQAVEWALSQSIMPVVVNGDLDKHALVHMVREYFNDHDIPYGTFSATDLDPYLPQ